MRPGGENTFDTVQMPGLSLPYVLPNVRRQPVLLLCDAGVWVGTQRNSSHPPGVAGGFHVSSANTCWEPDRAAFRNLDQEIKEGVYL